MDAALNPAKGRIGWGVVARQGVGEILRVWAGSVERSSETMIEEASAIRMGLLKAKMMGWQRIEIQSDCKGVINKLKEGSCGDPKIGSVLEDILQLKRNFSECSFSFVRREGNSVSHHVAKFAIHLPSDIDWKGSFPAWLVHLAKKDVRAVAQVL